MTTTHSPRITATTIAALLKSERAWLVQHEDGTTVVLLEAELLDQPDTSVPLRGHDWAVDLLAEAREQAELAGTSTAAGTLRAAAGREGTAELAEEAAYIASLPPVPVRIPAQRQPAADELTDDAVIEHLLTLIRFA